LEDSGETPVCKLFLKLADNLLELCNHNQESIQAHCSLPREIAGILVSEATACPLQTELGTRKVACDVSH